MNGENELPEGWISIEIPEICEINPKKPSRDSIHSDTPVTFVPMPAVDADMGAITEPERRKFGDVRNGFTFFQDGDVIFAKITPCMENGKAAIARNLINGLGFGSTEFFTLRSNGTVVPEYIYHFIRQESFRKAAEENMTGSVGQKRVPKHFIENSIIPLPPLAEQHRIVAAVEALLARVNASRERLDRVPGLLKVFRQAVLAAACSGRLTEGWRKKILDIPIKESLDLDNEIYDIEFPENWIIKKLGDFCQVKGGKRLPKGIEYTKYATSHPYLRVTDFQDMTVNLKDLEFITDDTYKLISSYTISKNDIYISIAGSIGKVGLIPDSIDGANLTENAAKIIVPRTIDKKFLCLILNSNVCQTQIEELTIASNQPKLALFRIKKIITPLPPLPEQHEIVRRVESLFALADRIEQRVSIGKERADRLTQAILAKAFRGELVPTEAELARREGREYEPASVLLERIRKERESQGEGKPRTRKIRAEKGGR